jgi:hypothetical protein
MPLVLPGDPPESLGVNAWGDDSTILASDLDCATPTPKAPTPP